MKMLLIINNIVKLLLVIINNKIVINDGSFLLDTGVVVLKNKWTTKLYNHFLKLHVAIGILLNESIWQSICLLAQPTNEIIIIIIVKDNGNQFNWLVNKRSGATDVSLNKSKSRCLFSLGNSLCFFFFFWCWFYLSFKRLLKRKINQKLFFFLLARFSLTNGSHWNVLSDNPGVGKLFSGPRATHVPLKARPSSARGPHLL